MAFHQRLSRLATKTARRRPRSCDTLLMIAFVLSAGQHSVAATSSSASSVVSTDSLYPFPTYNTDATQRLLAHNQALLPPISYESVKRAQEELVPSMQQLASSLIANGAPSYDTPEQNYTMMESELYPSSPLYSNYYLNPQYYSPVESGASNFAISPSVLEQFAGLLQPNQTSLAKQHKASKPAGLGRRIGELMSNSAERASRAFKSFSQFKLFNDIKPSRLLGLVSEQSADAKAVNTSAVASSPSSAWHYPPSSGPWSTYVPSAAPSSSSMFYQQPVYMRTPEMSASASSPASSVGSLNSIINPSSVTGSLPLHSSKDHSEYLGPISDFYPQKLSLDNSPMYQPAINSQSSSQYQSGSSSSVPLGTSTTTVYHHFPGDSNNGAGNNQQVHDLFAAPQTQFGLRVKPPKDFEFDGSTEDEMASSGENDDSKMADGGPSGGGNGGRNSMSNNDGPSNGEMGPTSSSDNNSPWSGGSSFDEYPEQGSGIDSDTYPYNTNSGPPRFSRPYNSGRDPVRENRPSMNYRPPSSRPFSSGIRRPMSTLPEFDDPTGDWYNTFFGANVKPMSHSRLRPFSSPFGNGPLNFLPHHSAPSLLNSASTQTPTSLSPESFMSPFNPTSQSPTPNYFHFPSMPRPAWPYSGLYPAANAYYNNFRPNPMMPAASAVRPVTAAMPYFPAANYFVPRYPRPPVLGAYPAYPASTYQAAPQPMPAPTPALMSPMGYPAGRFPTVASPFPMMASSSSLYPVRVPYSPMMSMPPSVPFGMASTILPAIAQPPILRYRYGPDLTTSASRRAINITKRVETDTLPSAQALVSKPQEAAYPIKAASRNDQVEHSKSAPIVPNREEQNLATLYNAYQVLQKRMDTNQSEQKVSSKSEQKPQPYYQYYIARDTTTSVVPNTTQPVDSSELLESSARESLLPKTIKTRHVQDDQMREHEKRQSEIRRFIGEVRISVATPSTTTTTTSTQGPPLSTRHAKAVSQLAAPTDEWRPLRVATSPRKRH